MIRRNTTPDARRWRRCWNARSRRTFMRTGRMIFFTAIRIAKEFNLDYVLVHGTEGHLITRELLQDRVQVLSGPFLGGPLQTRAEEYDAPVPRNTGKGWNPYCDHYRPPRDSDSIFAAVRPLLACREGMDREQALEAITITPARICGLTSGWAPSKRGRMPILWYIRRSAGLDEQA